MSDHSNRKFQRNAKRVEDELFQQIEAFIKKDSDPDMELDIQEVVSFFTKGLGQQSIQTWSFYSNSSDSGKFTSSTILLTKFLKFLGSHQETIEFAVQVIKDLLTSYQRTIYRALTAYRAAVTNPILRLLNEIIILNNGALLDDFFALFDFSLPVLPKLLQPSKYDLSNVEQTKEKEHMTIRYCFIRVLLNLLKFSPPLLRKDFITDNAKLLSAWFKHISTIDSEGLIEHTLIIWDEKILKEQSFKKSTKLKFFNEWNLSKLTPLYYSLKYEAVVTIFSKFIISLATDHKYGLRFPQDESWFIGQASASAPLTVNKMNFRTNNRLLYNLVSSMKPWDDDTQLRTTVQILKETPELVPPFTNYLASRGLHDPKLTSYWIGQTLLLSKIIRSDIPSDIEVYTGANFPSKYIIGELIVPTVMNKSVLTKCLQSESYLIRQLSVQLIVDALQKLEKFIHLYEVKNWLDAKVELINHIYNSLPDLATLTTSLTDSYAKAPDNKILLATLLTALNGYSIFNDSYNYTQAITKPFLDVINVKSFTPLDLVLLDNFFRLQEGESTQLKWWNKTDESSSLFTSLVKLSASTESVRSKITSLLCNLVKQTVVFNYDAVKEDPNILLVHSLAAIVTGEDMECEELSKIWKLLDECISRCVRTPFKYLDQSNANHRISPFVLVIFEQWKFVDKTTSYRKASKWLVLFARYLIIIGEPYSVILKLLKGIELECEFDDYIFDNSYEASIETYRQDPSLVEISKSYYFEFITTAPFKEIAQSNSIPVSDLDIVGALSRVSSIMKSSEVSLRDSEVVLSNIFSKIGNYWFTHPDSLKKFSDEKYWSSLYLQSSDEKSIYISNILVEIFSQLDSFGTDHFRKIVVSKLTERLSEGEQVVVSESLWAFNNEELRLSLQSESPNIKLGSLKLMLQRKLTIHSDQLPHLLEHSLLIPAIDEFITQDLVVFNDYSGFFKSIIAIEGTLPIFKSLSKHSGALPDLISFALTKKDPVLITYIASSLDEELVKESDATESVSALLSQAKQKAFDLVEKEDFTDISFNQLLRVFIINKRTINDFEKEKLIEYSLTKVPNKYTPEISNLIKAFGVSNTSLIRNWVSKSVLYFTKIYAEFTEFPPSFDGFAESFKDLLLNVNVSNFLNKSNTNALLEVIFTKWTKNVGALELASVFILTGKKSLFEFSKLLQILINNEEISFKKRCSLKARFYTALIISSLFEFDITKNSTVTIQEKILSFYSGSTRPDDLQLFSVLEKIESKLNASWIDQVYNWEFLDLLNEGEEDLIGETKLIEKKKEGFLVTLNKKFISNGLKEWSVVRQKFPTLIPSKNKENWLSIQKYFDACVIESPESISKTKYDPLFLSLLIINNDELIAITKEEDSLDMVVKSNMKKLIDAGLFSSIIMNLSSSDDTLVKVSKNILGSLLNSLKDEKTSSTFKDRHLFELLITKILFTYTQSDFEPSNYSPLVFIFIANLVPILINPGHKLFEKAYRWVLNAPFIKTNEIPLYADITTITGSGEDSENYYKQLTWLLETLIISIKTKQDIQLLRNRNVFEWLLNLENSPYVNIRIKFLIIQVILAIQNVEDGADILISRFGVFSNVEQHINHLIEDISEKKDVDTLQKEQELLNLKQIALRFGVVGRSKKRLLDWTSDDVDGFVKRIVRSE